jgi:hypothetical protein
MSFKMIGSDEDFMAFAGGSAIIGAIIGIFIGEIFIGAIIGLFIGPIIVLFIDKFGIKIFAIIIVSLISLIGIFMSLKLYQENQQEKYNNGYIFNKKIEDFLIKNFPPVLSKHKQILENIELVSTKIDKLIKLQDEFPKQKKKIDLYLDKWNKVKTKLENSLKEIAQKTEEIYVKSEINGINTSGHLENTMADYDKKLTEDIYKIVAEINIINEAYANEK